MIGLSKKREYFFLKNHAEYFKGPIYAVHPTVDEIPNFSKKNIFSSLEEIPNFFFFFRSDANSAQPGDV